MDYYVRYKFSFRERCFAFLGFIPIQIAEETQIKQHNTVKVKTEKVVPKTNEKEIKTPLHFFDKEENVTTNL